MGRAPCCSKVGLHRGPWTPREDTLLVKYIQAHGEGHWRSLPKKAGLLRCGKSCRLRWMNYLRPDIKRGNITPDEDDLIIRLHSLLGNRWSLIAGRLPGRTDNEIKNYWNTHLSKRLVSQGIDPNTHKKLPNSVLVQASVKVKRKKAGGGNKNPTKLKPVLDQETPKIHLPKPIRFTAPISLPVNEIFTSTFSPLSSSQGGEVQEEEVPWPDYVNDDENGTGNFLTAYYNDDDHDNFINGSGFECQSHHHHHHHHVPAAEEKIYQEFLHELLKTNEDQVVQLDSFTESLLI